MSPPSNQREILKSVSSTDSDGRFVIVDGIQTFYKIAIPQQEEQSSDNKNVNSHKPVILCLHQLFANLYTWKHQMQPLANATSCHVIAYDRIPFGFTERPLQWEEGKNPYTQEAMCEFALTLLSCLGYSDKKVVLIGSSSGATMGCYLSIKYPHIPFALILTAAALKPEHQAPPSIIRKILSKFPGNLILKTLIPKLVPTKSLYNDINSMPDWETVCRHRRLPLTLPKFYESTALFLKYFIPLEILPHKTILQKTPILYITGDNDKYLSCESHRKVFEEIKSNAPSDSILGFKVIEKCGHYSQEEKPQEFTQLIIDFLKKLGI